MSENLQSRGAFWIIILSCFGSLMRINYSSRSRRYLNNRLISIISHNLLYRTLITFIWLWDWSWILRNRPRSWWGDSSRCPGLTLIITIHFTTCCFPITAATWFTFAILFVKRAGLNPRMRSRSNLFRRLRWVQNIIFATRVWNRHINVLVTVWVAVLKITASTSCKIKTLIITDFKISMLNNAVLNFDSVFRLI